MKKSFLKAAIIINLLGVSQFLFLPLETVKAQSNTINPSTFNLRVTRENFAEFSDTLVIEDEEEIFIDISEVFSSDFDILTGDYEHSGIFSVQNQKFQPNIYKYIQDNNKLSAKNYGPKAPSVYNLNISPNRQAKISSAGGGNSSEFAFSDSSASMISYKDAFFEAKKLIQSETPRKARKLLFKMEHFADGNAKKLAAVGKLYLSIGEYQRACENLKKARGLDSENLEINYTYAVCLYKSNKLDLAEKFFKQSIEIEPSFMFAHYNLGNVYYKKYEFHKAIAAFENALELAPDNPNIHFNMAVTLELLGYKTLAKKFYKKVLELNPGDKPAMEALQKLNVE